MSTSVKSQLEKALAELENPTVKRPPSPIEKAKKQVSVESEGEAWVRIALVSAFGDWFQGGELVSELLPFKQRKFRADFSLPRYGIYVEVDGWAHHGKSLNDHHDDRLRGLYFSSFCWLPFRVSHAQAKNNSAELVDAIKRAMSLRDPLPRDALTIIRKSYPSGPRCFMSPALDELL